MSQEKIEKEEKKENNAVEVRLKRKEFNYLDSAMACCWFIVLQFVAGIITGLLPETFMQSFSVVFILSVLIEAIFLFAVLLVSSNRKVEFVKATKINKKPDFISVLLSIVISFVCLIAFSGLTNVFINVLYKLGYSSSSSLAVPNFFVYLIFLLKIFLTIQPKKKKKKISKRRFQRKDK